MSDIDVSQDGDLHARFRDAFNPDTGEFRVNTRLAASDEARDAELKASMASWGWLRELPGIKDEHGVTIVGHRRERIAAELGIPQPWPVITIMFGDGDEADAARFRLAMAANLGGAPLTRADRSKLAQYLYGERHWTMEKIGEALGVSTATAARDLAGFTPDEKTMRPQGGRPKGSPTRKIGPDQLEDVIAHADEWTWQEIARRFDVGQGAAQAAKTRAMAVIEERERQQVMNSLTPVLAPASAPPPPRREPDSEPRPEWDRAMREKAAADVPTAPSPAVNPPQVMPPAPAVPMQDSGFRGESAADPSEDAGAWDDLDEDAEVINGWTWDAGNQCWAVARGAARITVALPYETPPELAAGFFGIQLG